MGKGLDWDASSTVFVFLVLPRPRTLGRRTAAARRRGGASLLRLVLVLLYLPGSVQSYFFFLCDELEELESEEEEL